MSVAMRAERETPIDPANVLIIEASRDTALTALLTAKNKGAE